jgi:HPt (histidine-containing phosphotransfer) domain-containing protein
MASMASEYRISPQSIAKEQGAAASSRPVDLVHLSRYTLGERDLEREVLELFCTQATLYVERLRAAQSDKQWKDAAHSVKGSANAIGAWRVAAASERAEALSGEMSAELRSIVLREIEAAVSEAEAYIGLLLEDR